MTFLVRGDTGSSISNENLEGKSFAIYVSSQGGGVPENASALLGDLQNTFATLAAEGKINRVKMKKIGTEGEKRLCVEFATYDAAHSVWNEVAELAKNVELVDLKSEPCE